MLIKIKQCELILIFDFNSCLEHWNLEFGICLELRIWDLEFDLIGLI